MNWYNFYKNRLTLMDLWLEMLAETDESLLGFISFQNEELIRMEILKKLHCNYTDRDLIELKNQLELIFMLRDFRSHQLQINGLSEHALVDKMSSMCKTILNMEQNIDDRLKQMSVLKDISLMELYFDDIKKEYQKFLIFKSLKKCLLNKLSEINSPLAQLSHLFNDF